jgi:hypothetical protein
MGSHWGAGWHESTGVAVTVLVSAASRYGATAEIAERLGQALAERGVDGIVRDPADVEGLDGYDAAIVGSAVYDGHWLDRPGNSSGAAGSNSRSPSRRPTERSAGRCAIRPEWSRPPTRLRRAGGAPIGGFSSPLPASGSCESRALTSEAATSSSCVLGDDTGVAAPRASPWLPSRASTVGGAARETSTRGRNARGTRRCAHHGLLPQSAPDAAVTTGGLGDETTTGAACHLSDARRARRG